MPPEEKPWFELVVIPALLRQARHTYGKAMRAALQSAGFGDVPGNGLYVIGAMALNSALPFKKILDELDLPLQSTARLVDGLELGGYIVRTARCADVRCTSAVLTDRGAQAAAAMRLAREAIDAQLAARVGDAAVVQLRCTLGALIELEAAVPAV